jgi:hypothetical protein
MLSPSTSPLLRIPRSHPVCRTSAGMAALQFRNQSIPAGKLFDVLDFFRLHVQLSRRDFEVPKHRRTEPAFHRWLFESVPVAAIFLTFPRQLSLIAGKRGGGKQQSKSLPCVRDLTDEIIDTSLRSVDRYHALACFVCRPSSNTPLHDAPVHRDTDDPGKVQYELAQAICFRIRTDSTAASDGLKAVSAIPETTRVML